MLESLKKKLIYGKSYVGIEHVSKDQQELIHILEVRNNKNELHLIKEQSVLDLDKVQNHIKEKQHVFLIVNDRAVLSKKVEGKLNLLQAVQSAFPNIKLDQFYYESYSNDSDTFITICRKEHVDELLMSYKKKKVSILGFSLGNLISSQLSTFCHDSKICTSNALVTFGNIQLSSITAQNNSAHELYNINGLKLHSNSINSFSGILRYFSGNETTESSFYNEIKALKNAFLQRRVFENGLRFSMGFLFTILLINFMIFSLYQQKMISADSELVVKNQYKTTLAQLQIEIDKKKKIVDQINSAESNQVSFYLDEIAKSIPKSISLNELQFQPLINNIKINKEIKVDHYIIIINGTSNKGNDFSSWTALLESQDWINTVTVIQYGLGKKLINEFELKIDLKR